MKSIDKIKIEELRNQVADTMTSFYDTDFNLARWIQEHGGDVKKASERLKEHLAFRKILNLDDISSSGTELRHESFIKYYPYGTFGSNLISEGPNRNLIVSICPFGRMDAYGLMQTIPHTETNLGAIQDLEEMRRKVVEKEKETGEQWGLLQIIDLEGLQMDLSYTRESSGLFFEFSSFIMSHYPGLYEKIVIINEPHFLYYVWKILKLFFPAKITDKVHILSSEWKTNGEIFQFAHRDSLPMRWGGSLNDPTDSTILRIPPEGRVPSSEFRYSSAELELLKSKLTTIWISPGKAEVLSIKVEFMGANLKWIINTNNSWGFGIYYSNLREETCPDDMEAVYPHFSLVSQCVIPEEGSLKCEKLGWYKLIITSKTTWRKLKVEYAFEVE